jgi:hypothetical protein
MQCGEFSVQGDNLSIGLRYMPASGRGMHSHRVRFSCRAVDGTCNNTEIENARHVCSVQEMATLLMQRPRGGFEITRDWIRSRQCCTVASCSSLGCAIGR